MQWRERSGVRWLEAALPGATAAFSTRLGGASEGRYESLNLGLETGDDADRVIENRARLAAALGRPAAGLLLGRQVHGAEVARSHTAPEPNPWADASTPAGEADGQAAGERSLTPAVQVADCLPVALAGARGVAILHCGWRGLAAGVVANGVGAVEAVAAAIGPGIGACCYEVGEEVIARFDGLGPGLATGRMLDLAEVARRRLARAGVSEIESARLCTSCEPELFFSHRRDGAVTGRQGALAWSTGDG